MESSAKIESRLTHGIVSENYVTIDLEIITEN
jgi:hypothetical protein